mgnify:CR=1 FL=1
MDISTGEPDKVPTSGTYSDGASWNYDEKSETLTVSGDGGITEKELPLISLGSPGKRM